MITFNGFKPGETKTTTIRPKKVDGGHSIVEMSTTWRGYAFTFNYAVVCECGKRYTGRTMMRPVYSHDAHRLAS